jgi:hypothetical protein
MVACTSSLPASANRSTQSRCGASRAGSRKPKVRVRDSLRRASSDACSHSARTATRAAPVAVKERLEKSSCSSSASKRRTVASSTSDSSSPRSASAQSTRATGSGTRVPREQRRTASAAATGSSVQSPSGRHSWPIVASSLWSGPIVPPLPGSPWRPLPLVPGSAPERPPGGAASPGGASGTRPRAACTAPRTSPGSPRTGAWTASATTAATATSRAVYSITALPRSTSGLLSPFGDGGGTAGGPRDSAGGARASGTALGGPPGSQGSGGAVSRGGRAA